MKKPAVSGRTCPHCLVVTDPVCYGWHVGKCSSRKLVSTVKQDMAPGTPIENEVAGNSHFVEAPIHVLSPRDTPTLASDFQIAKGTVSGSLDSSKEELHSLREENQALKKDLKHKLDENEALNDKLKDLELKLEENQALNFKLKNLERKLEYLELRLKLSEEAERKALCLLESSSREKNEQDNEGVLHRKPTQSINVEDLGSVKCSGPGDSDNQFCHKQVEVVDNVKERGVSTDSAKSSDLEKRLDLDRIVDLACGEGAMSHGFLSRVIKAKETLPPTVNNSRKQRILSGALSNASNADDNQDIAERSGNPRSATLGVPNLQNEFSPREIPHEDQRFASHTSQVFHNVANKELPFMSSAPRAAIGKQCLTKDFNDTGCTIGLHADGHGAAKMKEEFSGKKSDCMRQEGENWSAPEMQHHAVDTSLYAEEEKSVASLHVPSEKESDLNENQIMKVQIHSSSVSTGSDINAVKAKSGFRRMVLQSDSESESGNIQGIHSRRDSLQAHLCDSNLNALPPMISDAEGERSDQSSVVLRVKNMCTSGKASQPYLRRSKRVNVVCISDQSDDAIGKGESEQKNPRSEETPRIAASDLEGVDVDGITDGEHAGVRRSKRLRMMSIQNPKNSLRKERMHAEKFSSSGDETSGNLEGSEVSKSEASASIPKAETQVKRRGPSRTRKRLFEDDESRPLYGNKHFTDSEEDDSEIESDADSLGDFITDSEGRESSRSSCEDHSSSSSYSSQEVYCDPKHKRDIKIKNYVWELEGEMLSVLVNDPKLCLRAVCALNRRQTEDEQKEKLSKYTNKRGFDSLHAARGSRLAEFLTDGDVSGPVKKSLKDLEKFDAGGIKFCKMLASKHSKQLFGMYTNAEDPHFPFA